MRATLYMKFSAANRRGLIEAIELAHGVQTVGQFSAANRRGLIEASCIRRPRPMWTSSPRRIAAASLKPIGEVVDLGKGYEFSAANRRGLIEASGTG